MDRGDVTAPEPFQTTRYRCPWCRRSWSARAAAAEHIARCWFNPETRSCKTCDSYVPAYHGDGRTESSSPERCTQGIKFEPHEYREGIIVLPLHCPKYRREDA